MSSHVKFCEMFRTKSVLLFWSLKTLFFPWHFLLPFSSPFIPNPFYSTVPPFFLFFLPSFMARPFKKINDINDMKELWKVVVSVHHKRSVVSNNKDHFEMIVVDKDVSLLTEYVVFFYEVHAPFVDLKWFISMSHVFAQICHLWVI